MGLRLPLLLWRRHHTLRKTRKIASRLEFLQSAIKMNHLFPTCELLFSSEDLYAGGVRGLTKTLRNFHLRDNQKLILVTVGLANPNEQENRDNIRVSLQKQLSPEVFYKIKFFHLRGRIDYNKLTFVYSMMMKLRYHSLRKKPLETLTSEDRTFINTYGKQASFIDFNALKPIIKEIYLPVERVP